MTAKTDDELPPFSPRAMLVIYAAGAILTLGILYTVWRDEINASLLAVRNAPRARSIDGEPGKMWNDVREAVGDATEE